MTEITDFLAGIGVNTHVDATTTGYGSVALVQASLAYLGIALIRDHAYDVDLAAYQTLAAAGVKFDLILDDDAKAELDSLKQIFASIRYVEGANEVDYQPILTNDIADPVLAAVTQQASVAAALAATQALLGTPLIAESVASVDNLPAFVGNIDYATSANLHSYGAYGASPGGVITNDFAAAKSLSSLPVAVTETGYYTMPTDESGVDENVQARLTLDTLFDTVQLGITPTMLYELLDEANDPGNTDGQLHYGLFHADGSPKPVATALHNLTGILAAADTTPGIAPTVAITFDNPPDTAQTVTLTGTAGTVVAVVWAEPQIWDPVTHTEISPPQTPTIIRLGSTIDSVLVFDPLVGTAPIAAYANISSLTVSLTDHPLLFQLSADIAVVTTPPVIMDPPVVTTPPVAINPPVVTTPPIITDPPVVTTPPVTTDHPIVTTPPVSTDPPVVPTPSVTTTMPPSPTPITTIVAIPGTGGSATSPPSAGPTIGVYRFFETTNGTHFFTATAIEAQTIEQTRPDLIPEGIGLRALDTAAGPTDPTAAPVYRFFDTTSGTQFLTASAAERDTVIATRTDLHYEAGDLFYEHATAHQGDTAVYRFFDTAHGTHFYTDSATERATILSTRADLVAEGVGFYEPPSA